MSRNDSLLYTGMSSSSFTTPTANKLATKREQDKREAERTKQKLAPQAPELMLLIAKERQALLDELAKPISLSVDNSRTLARIEAMQLNLSFIDEFKVKVNTLMGGK